MLSSIGPTGFIMLIVVALLLFGPSKLPELGKAFGKTLREFKNGTKNIMDDDDETGPRKDIRSEMVNVQEAQYSAVATEAKLEGNPQENRRSPA